MIFQYKSISIYIYRLQADRNWLRLQKLFSKRRFTGHIFRMWSLRGPLAKIDLFFTDEPLKEPKLHFRMWRMGRASGSHIIIPHPFLLLLLSTVPFFSHSFYPLRTSLLHSSRTCSSPFLSPFHSGGWGAGSGGDYCNVLQWQRAVAAVTTATTDDGSGRRQHRLLHQHWIGCQRPRGGRIYRW